MKKKVKSLRQMGVKKESKQWRSLIYDIEQARGKLFEYEEKMKSLEKSGKSTQQVPTEEYQKIQKDILKVNKELDAYREKKNKLQALGVSKESQEWKSLTYDIDQAKIAVEEYKTKARQMESSNTDVKRPVSLPKQALNFGTGIFELCQRRHQQRKTSVCFSTVLCKVLKPCFAPSTAPRITKLANINFAVIPIVFSIPVKPRPDVPRPLNEDFVLLRNGIPDVNFWISAA